MRSRFRLPTVLFIFSGILFGCPHRFRPAAAPVITSPDEQANQQFARARQLYDNGSLDQADAAFDQFIQAFPTDQLAGLARVYRGRIAWQRGKLQQAADHLKGPADLPAEDPVGQQARYYLGLVQIRLGLHEQGYRLLEPFARQVADEDRPEVLIALARAARQLNRPLKAISLLAELHEVTTRPVEKIYARTHLAAIIDTSLSSAQIKSLYTSVPGDSLLGALAGKRLAALETAAGNRTEAQRILDETAKARSVFGIGPTHASLKPRCNPRIVGLLVPFTGKYRAAGEKLLSGATAVAMAQRDDSFSLAIRDSNSDAAASVKELVIEDKVCALVGTLDPARATSVAREAAVYGVPFIALARIASPASLPQPPYLILPDNRQRTISLAQYAVKTKGLKRFVLVAPDNPYGAAMSEAFASAVQQQGRTIVARLTYPPNTKSFTDLAASLAKITFDALFMPDAAHSVALMAPALAKAGLWSGTRPSPSKRRTFQLLATADGLSERLLRSAGRYVQGAILAPGFFPDESARGSGPLARRFRESRGQSPGLVEALGHDAVAVIRALVEQGAADSASLHAALQGSEGVAGMTGTIRFGSDGHRSLPPPLYRVYRDQIVFVPAKR